MLPGPAIGKKKVLVVDDESGVLQVLEKIMRRAGYEVHSAGDGREGWRLFGQSSWDAVIIDRGIPEMNGEELGEAIKLSSPALPVILTTGMPSSICCPQRFEAILEKPFSPAELLDCLAHALQKQEEALWAQEHLV